MIACANCLTTESVETIVLEREVFVHLCSSCLGYLESSRLCGMFDRHQCPPIAERVNG